MTGELSTALGIALVWAVIYGLLAFGWVSLRDVKRVHGGLLFTGIFYAYSALAAGALAYMFLRLGLPLLGVDTSFLFPLELLVSSISTVMQLAGVVAVFVGMIMFIVRFFQDRSARKNTPPPPRAMLKQAKRKHARG